MNKRKYPVILFLSLLMASLTWGQPGEDVGFMPPGQPPYMQPRNMEAVKIYKLTQVLNLTDDQITKFIPALQKHEAEVRKEQENMRTILEEGRALLNADEMNQKDASKFIDRVTSQQAKIQNLNQDFLKRLEKYLTPRQQLQYLGFEERFRRQLQDFIRERQELPNRDQKVGKRMNLKK